MTTCLNYLSCRDSKFLQTDESGCSVVHHDEALRITEEIDVVREQLAEDRYRLCLALLFGKTKKIVEIN